MPLVHYCFSQHLNETLPPKRCTGVCKKRKIKCICRKCKCRKIVSILEATQLVKAGRAQWLIESIELREADRVCPVCLNSPDFKRSCANCNKKGTVPVAFAHPILSKGYDIVMVSSGSGDSGDAFRSVIHKKTPRVATIEKAHIERAYLADEDSRRAEEERARIEAYGEMDCEFLKSLIAPFIQDPWEGRVIWVESSDQRSDGTIWSEWKEGVREVYEQIEKDGYGQPKPKEDDTEESNKFSKN